MTVTYPSDMYTDAESLEKRRLVTLDIKSTSRGGSRFTFQTPASIEEAEWWADKFREFMERFGP